MSFKKCKKAYISIIQHYDSIDGTLDYIRTLLVLLHSLLMYSLACRPCISSWNVLNNICIGEMWVTKWMNGYIWNFYSAYGNSSLSRAHRRKNQKGCSVWQLLSHIAFLRVSHWIWLSPNGNYHVHLIYRLNKNILTYYRALHYLLAVKGVS